MTRFLVTAMPFTGHVAPMTAIAAALVGAGHDVRVYTGGAFRDRVEAVGARFVPWRVAPDFDEQDLPAIFPRLVGKKGFAQLVVNITDLFVATAPAQLADARRVGARAVGRAGLGGDVVRPAGDRRGDRMPVGHGRDLVPHPAEHAGAAVGLRPAAGAQPGDASAGRRAGAERSALSRVG